MKEIIKVKELDRGYRVVLIQTHKKDGIGDFDKYDVDVRDKNGCTVVVASSGCIGLKSGEFWMDNAVQFMQRLLLLVEARDMAYYNLLCYSKTYEMSEPKDDCESKWNYEKEKAEIAEKWLLDHSKYYGEKDSRTNLIRLEFDIHEIFAK